MLTALALGLLLTGMSLAQRGQNYVNSAHDFVVEKMEKNWRTRVNIEEWISSEVQYLRDNEVVVRGRGRVTKRGDNRVGRFDYNVRLYTKRRRAADVSYDVSNWEDNGRYDDRYFQERAESAVRDKLERDLGYSLFVNFKSVSFYDARGNLRGVKGDGDMYRRASDRRGKFTFDVKFDRVHGDSEVIVVSVKSRPGNDDWRPDGPEDRRFIRNAREAVQDKFSGRTQFDWRNDEEVGDVVFGVRTITGTFTARGGNKPGRYQYRVRLGAGTGDVQSVSVFER